MTKRYGAKTPKFRKLAPLSLAVSQCRKIAEIAASYTIATNEAFQFAPPPAPAPAPKIKTVYIAGKITGDPEYKEKFDVVELALARAGYTPVNPAVLPEDAFTYEEYMIISEEMLKGCDAVYFLSDWVKSKGARYEMGCSLAYRKQVLIGDVVQAANLIKNFRSAVLTEDKLLLAGGHDILS